MTVRTVCTTVSEITADNSTISFIYTDSTTKSIMLLNSTVFKNTIADTAIDSVYGNRMSSINEYNIIQDSFISTQVNSITGSIGDSEILESDIIGNYPESPCIIIIHYKLISIQSYVVLINNDHISTIPIFS